MTCITSKSGNRHTVHHHPRESPALESARQNRYTDPLHTASADRSHGFAVANLRRWAAGGADLVVMLPYLSAYMGHADLRGTQYYLQLTADAHPEVAAMASARFGYVIPGPAGPPQGARQ
jgi:integrase